MHRLMISVTIIAGWVATALAADEVKIELAVAQAPSEKLPEDVAKLIGKHCAKVTQGTRVLCEIWPSADWPADDKRVKGNVLYALMPGQLIGLVRFPRKITDFRQQEIPAGVYTLRYGVQPEDGAHVGTFPTRDFLLVLPADKDVTADPISDYKQLTKASASVTGTAHPAIFPLLAAPVEGEFLAVRHDEEKDWTIIRFGGSYRRGLGINSTRVEMVLIGHAAE